MKRGWIIGIVLVLLIVGFFAFYEIEKVNNRGKGGGIIVVRNDSPVQETVKDVEQNEKIVENLIEMTSSGFNPETLEIDKGEEVIFVNKDSTEHWPASDLHPTHRTYPGSDIAKCETLEETNIFDSCKGLAQNGEYKFIFNEKGTWNYHDHISAGMRGKIIVN